MNCPSCSDEFDSDRAMKIHHKLSHGNSIAIEKSSCKNCNNTFEYYPSDKDGVYCSDCVNNPEVTWSNGGLFGEDNPRYNIDPEDHPMWRGGYDIKYIGSWHRVKEERLEIDNHKCQRCGAHKEELGQEPDVHHITPVRLFDNEEDAHTLDNTVCLCRSCHAFVENKL